MQKLHAVLRCLLPAACLWLGACATLLPDASPRPVESSVTPPACPACPVCAACPPTAVAPTPALPFARHYVPAAWADLPGWADDDHAAAWPAFLQSCRGMASRPHAGAWKGVCDQARQAVNMAGNSPAVRAFFEKHLRPYAVQSGDGKADGMVTGYYEPLLRGNRSKQKGFEQPVRGVPDDLLTIDLSQLFPELKDKRVRGRLEGNKVVAYWSRAEIQARGERLPAKTLLYVDDAIELFFLQIQGSGRVRLPDGSMVRLNYADQNGHPYQSIGRVLIERGDLKPEEASMQGIQAWARAHPGRLNDLLNANPSYVFFRELPDSKDGPLGALGVSLTAERSIAIDPRAIPLGAPVFLASTRPNSTQLLQRLMLAQDTGGAIKGAVRADFFWGFGREAGEQAGRMKQSGRYWLLWPQGAALK